MKNLNVQITKKFSKILVTIEGQLTAKKTNDLINALPHLVNERHDLVVLDLCGLTNIDQLSTEAIINAKGMMKNIGAQLDIISHSFNPIFDKIHEINLEDNFRFLFPIELQTAC